MRKIFISPNYNNDISDDGKGGVRRVVDALSKYISNYGWEVVNDPDDADLINVHVHNYLEYIDKPIVSTNHGLYWNWDTSWGEAEHATNKEIIKILKRVDGITCPSVWVQKAINRGLMKPIEVIGHGVDTEYWKPKDSHGNYILYNKNRVDRICNPDDLITIANKTPNIRYKAVTVPNNGLLPSNVTKINVEPIDTHRDTIANALLYLSITRETFGNSIIESLACGVPVVGWDYGGASEIVVNGYNGYLAPVGDFDTLAIMINQAISERDTLSKNAIKTIENNYKWEYKVKQYAGYFDKIYENFHKPKPKVSVVIPVHNGIKYVKDAINSVKNQTLSDWECIVVNDCSTDSTEDVVMKHINDDDRFTYVKNEQNMQVSNSRNIGARYTKGKYISFLDYDDYLAVDALEKLSQYLDKYRNLDLVYGGLENVQIDGNIQKGNWPKDRFRYHQQIAYMNQVPTFNMMRRDWFVNIGGYRSYLTMGEDAELWARLSSFGCQIEKVTDDTVLYYRIHPDQKTQNEKDSKWLARIPWRLSESRESGKKLKNIINDEYEFFRNFHLIPFGVHSNPPSNINNWAIHHHNSPKISIIIPVCAKHIGWLQECIDSILAQDFYEWEIVVVNDTGKSIDLLYGAYFVKVINPSDLSKTYKQSISRNIGTHYSKGEVLLFLDADDYLLPDGTLSKLWDTYIKEGKNKIIYGDLLVDTGTEIKYSKLPEPYCGNDWEKTCLHKPTRPVTFMINKNQFLSIGGFDPEFDIWEDWDLEIRLTTAEICAKKIEVPIFVYRHYSSTSRILADPIYNEDKTVAEKNLEIYKNKLFKKHENLYNVGVNIMGKTCCGGIKHPIPKSAPNNLKNTPKKDLREKSLRRVEQRKKILMAQNGDVGFSGTTNLRYIGRDNRFYLGASTNKRYRFGTHENHRVKAVDNRDVQSLLSMGFFVIADTKNAPIVTNEDTVSIDDVKIKQDTDMVKDIVKPKYVKDILEALPLLNIDTLHAWLIHEKKNKNRKTIVLAIEGML